MAVIFRTERKEKVAIIQQRYTKKSKGCYCIILLSRIRSVSVSFKQIRYEHSSIRYYCPELPGVLCRTCKEDVSEVPVGTCRLTIS